ncbi:MAG: nucleotide exchange factor GrpE [Pseudomonadota bacterium]
MGDPENKQTEAENVENIDAKSDIEAADEQADAVADSGASSQSESEGDDVKAPNGAAPVEHAAAEVKKEAREVEEEALEYEEHIDLAAELENAQSEIVKLKDAFLRAKAEEDNVRRRSEKEVANSRKFAVEGFAKEMMNVYDSLKLACSVEVGDEADAAVKSIHEGVEITLKQLNSAFAKFALVEIAPEPGDKLDPNLHQAMSMIESDEVDPGCIINVIQSGFSLHDRLLRPAMVVVAKT